MGAIKLSQLLARVPEETEALVDATRRRLNQRVRDMLRRETGLTLVSRRGKPERGQVMVKTMPGLPNELEAMQFSENAWVLPYLIDLRRNLASMATALPRIHGRLKRAATEDPRAGAFLNGRLDGLPHTIDLLEDLVRLLEKDDPIPRILAVNKDVLGIYQYSSPEPGRASIELYWGVIALVAGGLNVRLEALTAVVLAHELAHAYSHLGVDIDGRQWERGSFANAQHDLVEGLAQYYTHLVVSELEAQVPGVEEAYRRLLVVQPAAYRRHLRWLPEERPSTLFPPADIPKATGDSTPEEVRFAMLEMRRTKGPCTIETFARALELARSGLRGPEDRESRRESQ